MTENEKKEEDEIGYIPNVYCCEYVGIFISEYGPHPKIGWIPWKDKEKEYKYHFKDYYEHVYNDDNDSTFRDYNLEYPDGPDESKSPDSPKNGDFFIKCIKFDLFLFLLLFLN